MKSLTTVLTITLFVVLPVTFVQAQGTPKPNEKIAGAGKRTDVYHVHFTKAALGKAAQLGDWLKTPNPNEPMPYQFIVSSPSGWRRMGLRGHYASGTKGDCGSCWYCCASGQT